MLLSIWDNFEISNISSAILYRPYLGIRRKEKCKADTIQYAYAQSYTKYTFETGGWKTASNIHWCWSSEFDKVLSMLIKVRSRTKQLQAVMFSQPASLKKSIWINCILLNGSVKYKKTVNSEFYSPMLQPSTLHDALHNSLKKFPSVELVQTTPS